MADRLERIQHMIVVVQARNSARMVWRYRGRTWSPSVNIADYRSSYERQKTNAVPDSCAALLIGAEVQNIRTDISTVVCPEDGHIIFHRNLPAVLPSTYQYLPLTVQPAMSSCPQQEALFARLLSTDQHKGQSS